MRLRPRYAQCNGQFFAGSGQLSLGDGPNELNKQLCRKVVNGAKNPFTHTRERSLSVEEDKKHGKVAVLEKKMRKVFPFSPLLAHPKKRCEIVKRFGARSTRRSENFAN